MTSDEERREVARRLRECRGGWSSGECYHTIIHALGLSDTSREDGGAALYAHLADLIEPKDMADRDEVERRLLARLMPDGMEWLLEAWPRFNDDSPLKLGDMALIDGEVDMVEAVQLWIHGKPVIYGDGGSQQLERGERVKRPAKVLDADGAEIRVGDTVYDMVGDRHEVKGFGKQGDVLLEFHNDESLGWRPSNFTHRTPVLAADGEPLREGETVWDENGDELVIGALEDGGHTVTCRYADVGDVIPVHGMWSPSQLTHERPVLDADGKPLREGETVWHKQTGRAATVKGFDRLLGEPCAVIDFAGIEQRVSGTLLTHERPVFDADGVPIRVGDTVYLLPGKWCGEYPLRYYNGGDEMVVKELDPEHELAGVLKCVGDGKCTCFPLPRQLTHTKPEPIDTWERLEEDADRTASLFDAFDSDASADIRDLVRRAKALAERERGE